MSVDKELSLIIWGFLVLHLVDKNILRGYYRWQGTDNKSHEKDFDSKICALLKRTEWLFDENGAVHKPTELKSEELAKEYRYDLLRVEAKEHLALLSFKSSAIEDIEKQGYIVIAPDEAELFEEFKKQQKQNGETKDVISWEQASPDIASPVIEVTADTIEVCTKTTTFKPKKSKDLRRQTSYSFFENEFDEERPTPMVPRAVRKAIGEWSEEYVYRYLMDFCEKNKNQGYSIRRMNEGGNVGYGYDFVLMRGDEELRYIEVKGRAADTNEFEITKTQWGFAKFLFDRGEGDKYSIFVVKNAGKTDASLVIINSPVKMWLEGDLEMVEIRLLHA